MAKISLSSLVNNSLSMHRHSQWMTTKSRKIRPLDPLKIVCRWWLNLCKISPGRHPSQGKILVTACCYPGELKGSHIRIVTYRVTRTLTLVSVFPIWSHLEQGNILIYVSRTTPINLSQKAAAVWKKNLLEHLQRYFFLQVLSWCFPFLAIKSSLLLWSKVWSQEGFELTKNMLWVYLYYKNNQPNKIYF